MSSNNVENNFPYIHETNQDLEKLKNRENQKTSTEKWRDAPPRERERERKMEHITTSNINEER